MQERKIRILYGSDGCAMARQLLEAADVATRIRPGAKIVLKPNLVSAQPPENGATTHTDIVEGVLQYLQASGFQRITIAESSWVGEKTARSFRTVGLDRLAARYGVSLLDLKEDDTVSVETPIGKMQVFRTPLEADCLINLPVLKGHCQTVMTCALKNMKGCIPDGEKRRFHALGLMKPIAALATVLRPHWTLVDSLCGDLSFEEGGNPVQTDRMLLGEDPVQMDAFCCHLLGIQPAQVEYISLAQQYGVGSMAWKQEDILSLNTPVQGNGGRADGKLVQHLGRHIRQDAACSACYSSLIRALYQYRQRHGRDYGEEIVIGQGFRKQQPGCLGVGNCCRGAARNVAGCPPSAAEILTALEG